MTQIAQQTLLVIIPGSLEVGSRIGKSGQTENGRWQLHRQIGIEQVLIKGHFQTSQLLHLLIISKQAQHGVIRALCQVIQIAHQCRDGRTQLFLVQGGCHLWRHRQFI